MIDFSASPAHEFGPLCGILTSIKWMAAKDGVEFMLVGGRCSRFDPSRFRL